MSDAKLTAQELIKFGTERATSWSITINNPTDVETRCEVPGWSLEGQYEVGEEGTRHFQGMLKTPQVRFAAVKKVFPRAHIEVARNEQALKNYVHKVDSRVDVYTPGAVPTIFQYQAEVAAKWIPEEWEKRKVNIKDQDKLDECAMRYLDSIVEDDIISGKRGCEWIAINPMWRSSWKKFWASIITRHALSLPPSSPSEEADEEEEELYDRS